MYWTNPYHGVEHLIGTPKHINITLTKYDNVTIGYMCNRYIAAFTPQKEISGEYEMVKETCEKWAKRWENYNETQ